MEPRTPVYLDCHSTTPLRDEVLEAMLPFLKGHFGNASSSQHAFGWKAKDAVELARDQVAQFLGAKSKEIIFTSGATESNALAIRGWADEMAAVGKPLHLVTTRAEHKAVLEQALACQRLWKAELTLLDVNKFGGIENDQIRRALLPDTGLVSVILANNEVGTINPIATIAKTLEAWAERTGSRKPLLHTDAVQAGLYLDLDTRALGVDLLSLSAHKMNGPKGVGCLFIRKTSPRIKLHPLMQGGGQELNLRSGTLNVPGIVGFGKACELALRERSQHIQSVENLRDLLASSIRKEFPTAIFNGYDLLSSNETQRLPNNLSVTFPDVDMPRLLAQLSQKVCVSTGSACANQTGEPSHVLVAMGLDDEHARRTLRFGLGHFTAESDVHTTMAALRDAIHKNPQ